jgi:hypothetical protein
MTCEGTQPRRCLRVYRLTDAIDFQLEGLDSTSRRMNLRFERSVDWWGSRVEHRGKCFQEL